MTLRQHFGVIDDGRRVRCGLAPTGPRVRLAGHGRDRCRDIGEAGMEVAAGHRRWRVSGERLSDRVAADAADRGDGGVPQDMRRHRCPGVPTEHTPGAGEERVVVAGGHRCSGPGEEDTFVAGAVPASVVSDEGGEERRRDGLLALVAALLAEPERGSSKVEVGGAEVECALSAGAGLEVEPDQEQVEGGVTAGEAEGVGEIGDLLVVEGPAAATQSSGLGQCGGGVGAQVAGGHRPSGERSERGDAGLLGGPAAAVRVRGSGAIASGPYDGS